MRPSQKTHPDDPFRIGWAMRTRIAVWKAWWRHPRASRLTAVLLIAATAVTVIVLGVLYFAGPSHCITIPAGGGAVARSCPP